MIFQLLDDSVQCNKLNAWPGQILNSSKHSTENTLKRSTVVLVSFKSTWHKLESERGASTEEMPLLDQAVAIGHSLNYQWGIPPEWLQSQRWANKSWHTCGNHNPQVWLNAMGWPLWKHPSSHPALGDWAPRSLCLPSTLPTVIRKLRSPRLSLVGDFLSNDSGQNDKTGEISWKIKLKTINEEGDGTQVKEYVLELQVTVTDKVPFCL